MPFAAVNGIDVHFELHGTGAPLLNMGGSGNDLRRSPASILPVNKAFEARQLCARAGHDVVEDLASIGRPTLVCARHDDDIAPVANSELIAERMPNATLRVFDGGHTTLIQDRTAFPTIIEFLQSTPGGAS